MSHEIESNKDAVWSAAEGAGWTGLGRAIPADIAKDASKIAEFLGATWSVEALPVYVKQADGSFREVSNAKGQVRSDTGRVLSLTSNLYKTENRQPRDYVEAFDKELRSNGMDISHAAVLGGGEFIAVSALMNPDFDIIVGKGDRVQSYVTLSGGYNLKHGTKATKGGMRVVCKNTLMGSIALAERSRQIRTIRATQELEFDSLSKLIENVKSLVDAEREAYNQMNNSKLSDADVLRFFADTIEVNVQDLDKTDKQGKKIISTKSENILKALAAAYKNAPGQHIATGTVWGALNAVTYFATHQKTVRDTKDDGAAAARVASNMYGGAAQMKARAQSLALQKIGVLQAA